MNLQMNVIRIGDILSILTIACIITMMVGCSHGISEEGMRESRPIEGSVNKVALKRQVSCSPQVVTGYSNGTPKDITVVEIDAKPVELATANAYAQMQAAAADDGIDIRVLSGFRSQGEQQYLYDCYMNCNCNNCNLAAYPGHSNHQSGLALDLNTQTYGVLHWLNRNGARFGFMRTVPSEDWHWEYFGGVEGGPCVEDDGPRSGAIELLGFSEGEQYRNGQWLRIDSKYQHLHHVEYHVNDYSVGVSEDKAEGFPIRLVLDTLGRRTLMATGYDAWHRKIGESQVTVTFVEGETATSNLKFSNLRSGEWYRNGFFLEVDNVPEGTKSVEYGVGSYVLGASNEGDGFFHYVQLQSLGYRAFHVRALAADGLELGRDSVLIRILPGDDNTVSPSMMFVSPEPADLRHRTVEIHVAASESVASIHLDADGWSIGRATLSEGLWQVTHHFHEAGERRLTAIAEDADGKQIAQQSVTFTVQ